jgi:hypothetical protein
MAKSIARLISVTEQNWGPDLPESLSSLTNVLLPVKRKERSYNFTGKRRPRLAPNETLVFRYKGVLLGEAKFLRWHGDDPDCMMYRPIRQYRERVVGSDFFSKRRRSQHIGLVRVAYVNQHWNATGRDAVYAKWMSHACWLPVTSAAGRRERKQGPIPQMWF